MRYLNLIAIGLVFFLFGCGNNVKSSSPLVVTMTGASGKKCVHDTICAEINLSYPVLSGGDNPKAVAAINDSLLSFVYLVIGGDRKMPLPQAFDSAVWNLYLMLEDDVENRPDLPMGFSNEMTSKNLFQNNQLISLELLNSTFTGGAHGSYGSALFTFSLLDGRLMQLEEVVRDTAALRPLIEKGFVAAFNSASGDSHTLEEIVFPESIPLPLPVQWCIVKEGLKFTYNPYEVAPYAVGQTNILLTWEQLGALAEKNKWTGE